VCITTLALGSKELSKHGAIVTRLAAIVTRLAAIEDMAGMTMLCSDKTRLEKLNILFYGMLLWLPNGMNLLEMHLIQ